MTSRIRNRALALSAVAALAAPAGASAMPIRGDGPVGARDINAPAVVALRHENRSTATDTAPATILREIRTVTDGTDQTLPIVLGAVALGIALGGAGYVAVRIRPMLRPTSSR